MPETLSDSLFERRVISCVPPCSLAAVGSGAWGIPTADKKSRGTTSRDSRRCSLADLIWIFLLSPQDVLFTSFRRDRGTAFSQHLNRVHSGTSLAISWALIWNLGPACTSSGTANSLHLIQIQIADGETEANFEVAIIIRKHTVVSQQAT